MRRRGRPVAGGPRGRARFGVAFAENPLATWLRMPCGFAPRSAARPKPAPRLGFARDRGPGPFGVGFGRGHGSSEKKVRFCGGLRSGFSGGLE